MHRASLPVGALFSWLTASAVERRRGEHPLHCRTRDAAHRQAAAVQRSQRAHQSLVAARQQRQTCIEEHAPGDLKAACRQPPTRRRGARLQTRSAGATRRLLRGGARPLAAPDVLPKLRSTQQSVPVPRHSTCAQTSKQAEHRLRVICSLLSRCGLETAPCVMGDNTRLVRAALVTRLTAYARHPGAAWRHRMVTAAAPRPAGARGRRPSGGSARTSSAAWTSCASSARWRPSLPARDPNPDSCEAGRGPFRAPCRARPPEPEAGGACALRLAAPAPRAPGAPGAPCHARGTACCARDAARPRSRAACCGPAGAPWQQHSRHHVAVSLLDTPAPLARRPKRSARRRTARRPRRTSASARPHSAPTRRAAGRSRVLYGPC